MNIDDLAPLESGPPDSYWEEQREKHEEHIKSLIADGYIAKDGEPLKCIHCESKELEEKLYYEEHWIVERDIACKKCGKPLGNWAYGHWGV